MATVSFVAAAQTDAHKAAAEAAKTLTEAPKTEEKVKKPTHWKSEVAHGSHNGIIAAEIFFNCFGLRGRFHDDQILLCFRHADC